MGLPVLPVNPRGTGGASPLLLYGDTALPGSAPLRRLRKRKRSVARTRNATPDATASIMALRLVLGVLLNCGSAHEHGLMAVSRTQNLKKRHQQWTFRDTRQ